jgi:hypothetical protein
MSYRSLPRYANSDLGEFRDTLFSFNARKPSAATLAFGTIFHALTLECKAPDNLPAPTAKQLGAMRESILQDKFARHVLQAGEVEQVQVWTDNQTGLPCKALKDIWVAEDELIVDLKTTSARTYGAFLKCCEDYAYDRQAAFYLDGNPFAKRFVILGIQKQPPFGIFYFEATACRGCIESGRKKYQGLLRGILRDGFTPSSWVRSDDVKLLQL